MLGSEADVKRLKEADETVGFDVYVYRDCTMKVIASFIIDSQMKKMKDLVIILMK